MLLQLNQISFSYGIHTILDQVSFIVNENEHIGIVGPNGAGKSTLLKILSGELTPDGGQIHKLQGLTVGYLPQEDYFPSESPVIDIFYSAFDKVMAMEDELSRLTGLIATSEGAALDSVLKQYGELQERFDAVKGYEYHSRVRGMAKGLHFSENQLNSPFKLLSGGEKSRVALGYVLLSDPDFMLLDEPTNYLDIHALQYLEDYLKGFEGGFLLVSHDRYFLDKVCNRIIEVNHSKIKSYEGNYSRYAEQRERDLMARDALYAHQLKEIQRQKQIIQRFRDYNSKHSSKRALSREKALAKMPLIDKTPQDKHLAFRFIPKSQSGEMVLNVEELSKSFDDTSLFENVGFEILKGDKIGLIGANGVGKTTLFRMLLKKIPKNSGRIRFGSKVHVGYFDQENRDIKSLYNENLLEALWEIDNQLTEGEIRNILATFLFTGDSVFKRISELSGGEKSRLALARLMISNANFLMMDEPTNHLDMQTKEVLENALTAYEGTLFFISHDRYLLNKVCTQIFELTPAGIEVSLGNYDDYLFHQEEKRLRDEDRRRALEGPEITKTRQKQIRKKQKEQTATLRALKKQIKSIENEIDSLESHIDQYETTMCAPNFYENIEEANRITMDYHQTQQKSEQLLEEWTALHVKLEELENEFDGP